MTSRTLCWSILAVHLSVGWACEPLTSGRDHASGPEAGGSQPRKTIEHLVPARDSVGATPTRFEWTPIEGAEHYVFVVFNEVDGVVYRRDDVEGASLAWPSEEKLEWGTYFWTVTALRNEQPIAESGRSAFVVVK